MFAAHVSTGKLSGDKDSVVEYISCSSEGTSADIDFFFKSEGMAAMLLFL